jgi:histidinol dehydrogenase
MPCLTLDLNQPGDAGRLLELLAERRRSGLGHDPGLEERVRSILAEVREQGLEAVLKYNRLYDSPDFSGEMFRLDGDFLRKTAESISCAALEPILEAAENIRAFHQEQKEKAWFISRPDGLLLGQTFHPVRRVGLYVPGGRGGDTPLISSLLMTAIPALVAGVPEIVAVSPPRADGSINPFILAAAGILGLSAVYACGSAWAIGALAYGAGPLEAVDVIAGPGNIWVNAAKRQLVGQVGIDLIAGPSEIVIIADESADPVWLAADMLAQAEHDPLASAVCLLTEPAILSPLREELRRQSAALPRAETAASSLRSWGVLALVPNLEQACVLANRIAPEHLEVMCAHPWEILPQITAAGAVFLGRHSAEALGDYYAGPNHVLPTLGTARFASGLGVQTFMTRTNVISAGPGFAFKAASGTARLARLEGLEAHARSAELRGGEFLMKEDYKEP